MPVRRPSASTWMRSLRPMSSLISEEMRITERPAATRSPINV
ncbi:hypothetical protein ACFPRL_13670 [Pseudoclavibacter helvolus]